MDGIPGQTLHTHIRHKKAQAYTSDEFGQEIAARSPRASQQSTSKAWARRPEASNVIISEGRGASSTWASRGARARLSARRPGAPPDGGTPNYMSPERLRNGGASEDDDVCAMALLEMWTRSLTQAPSRTPSRRARSCSMCRAVCESSEESSHLPRHERGPIDPQARGMRFLRQRPARAAPRAAPRPVAAARARADAELLARSAVAARHVRLQLAGDGGQPAAAHQAPESRSGGAASRWGTRW